MTDAPTFLVPGSEPLPGMPVIDTDLADPDEVTITCEFCPQTFTGVPKGKNSVVFQYGRHRNQKHKAKSPGKSPGRPKTGAPTEAERAARPVVSILRDVTSDIGLTSTKPPSDKDIAAGLGKGISLLTVAGAAFMVDTDPNMPEGPQGDEMRNYWVEQLSMASGTATDLMRPIGKLVAPTKINQKYGRKALDNVDVLGSVFELGSLAMMWRKYFRMRAAGTAPAAIAPAPLHMVTPGAEMPDPGAQIITSPPPQNGVVLTPKLIEAQLKART